MLLIFKREEGSLMVEEKKFVVDPDFNKKSSTGMDAKIAVLVSHAGILFWWGGWISGLIIYLLEKDNKFVKFHAMQSIIIGVAAVILNIIVVILAAFTFGIGGFLFPLIAIAELAIRIIIVIKAYNGELYKFPGAGKLAEKYTKM